MVLADIAESLLVLPSAHICERVIAVVLSVCRTLILEITDN